jgi:uncharacterized damage-inducible protein DinB
MAHNRDVELLLTILDQAYDRPSWHGTNLRGSLRGLTPEQAVWRPAPGRHNIWELVAHAAYWKYIARRRMTGEKRGSFALAGSDWFERGDALDRARWRADIALLDEMHRLLRENVAMLSDRDLARRPAGSRVSSLAMLSGVAAHDLYHAGQIQLLKRLRP